MTVDVKVPVLPESVSYATVAKWHKKEGDFVAQDELLVDIETDKVVLEVTAATSGVLTQISQKEGAQVKAEQLLAVIDSKATTAVSSTPKEPGASSEQPSVQTSPAVRKMLAENNLSLQEVAKSGQQRLSVDDVAAYLEVSKKQELPKKEQPQIRQEMPQSVDIQGRIEKREPLSAMRRRIAERLVSAQHNAAILTTFNEVDMSAIIGLRQKYQELFIKKHQIKLGFMSFFMKAALESLIKFPMVNASIDGDDIVYRNYCDLSVAVSSERGLVVPVVRNAQSLSIPELEKELASLASKARDGALRLEEITGGTFTITNGGVFGSLLSTPIINPPQTAILGMHKIQERPVALSGQVVVRPMMYLALSYDHRLIDGATAVSFLVNIKTLLEEPERIFLELD